METIDTNAFPVAPQGGYILAMDRIVRKELKSKAKGTTFVLYEVYFDVIGGPDGAEPELKISMFKSDLGPVLKAVGAVERENEPGKFDYDPEAIKGKRIKCELIHMQDTNGKKIEKLLEIEAHVGEVTEKAWDET